MPSQNRGLDKVVEPAVVGEWAGLIRIFIGQYINPGFRLNLAGTRRGVAATGRLAGLFGDWG